MILGAADEQSEDTAGLAAHAANAATAALTETPEVATDSVTAPAPVQELQATQAQVPNTATDSENVQTPGDVTATDLPHAFSMAELTAEIFRATLQPKTESDASYAAEGPTPVSAEGTDALTISTQSAPSTAVASGTELATQAPEVLAAPQAAVTAEAVAEIAAQIAAQTAAETAALAQEQELNPVVFSFSPFSTFSNVARALNVPGTSTNTPQQAQQLLSPQALATLFSQASHEGAPLPGESDAVVMPPPVSRSEPSGLSAASVLRSGAQGELSLLPEQAMMAPLLTAAREVATTSSAHPLPGSAAALLSEAATQLETRFEVFKQMEQHLYLLRHHQQREIQIQLEPAQLGKLNLRLQQEGHLFQLHITAENAVAKEILEAHIQQLKDQFSQQGFALERVNVNVNSDASGGFDSEESQSQDTAAFMMPHGVSQSFSLLSAESDHTASFLNYGSAAPAYYYHQVNYFA